MLVVGAGGNVGSAVVRSLLAAGRPVRAAHRDPARIAERFPGAQLARLDLEDRSTFAAALEGVGAMFLLRPPPIARVRTTMNALLDAADARGTEHVVFLSVASAETNRLVPHHRVERHLMDSGSSWTILRPGFFAQNLGDAYRQDILDDDRLHVPAGQGRVAFVDVRDIGDVIAAVFVDPAAHRGSGYHLTGPRAVDFEEVAAVLTERLGRAVHYEAASVPGYVRHLRGRGLPLAQTLVQTVLHVGLRRGDAEEVDPTLERLLGRPAHDLREYVADHAGLWQRSGVER